MSQSLTTRQSLLLRVRDPADKLAWRQFTEIYLPLIHRHCRKRGLQDADATDVGQDVLTAVAQKIARFDYDPKRGSFRGWLLTVTRNKLANFVKRMKVREQGSGRTTVHELLAEQPEAQQAEDWDRDCRQRIFEWAAEQAREHFQETTWRAFRMTAVEGRSAEEAAKATGLSVGAVYIAKSRVLARLRQLVQTVDDGEIDLGEQGKRADHDG